MSNATLAAIDVIEASLDGQLQDWQADPIWRNRIENDRAAVRLSVDGHEVELSGIRVSIPWRRRKQLRAAIARWAARKAVQSFKGTDDNPKR